MGTDIGKDSRESFHELVEALRRDRERLSVQINLGVKELHDEWHAVEEKWSILERHLDEFTEDAKDAARRVGEEIAETYRRLRDRVK